MKVKDLYEIAKYSAEEIADKLARIRANSQVNTDMALECILNGGV